jgi:hypothetical protein
MIVYSISENASFSSVVKNIEDFIEDYRRCIRSSENESITSLQFDIRINNSTFVIANEIYNRNVKLNEEIIDKFIERLIKVISKCLNYTFDRSDFRINISDLYSARYDDFICKFIVKDDIVFVFPIKYLLENFEDLIELRKFDIKNHIRTNPISPIQNMYFANLEGFEDIVTNKVKVNKLPGGLFTTITPENIMKVVKTIKKHSEIVDIVEIYPHNLIISFGHANPIRKFSLHQRDTITIQRDEKTLDKIFNENFESVYDFVRNKQSSIIKLMMSKYEIPKQYLYNANTINVYYTIFDDVSELINTITLQKL